MRMESFDSPSSPDPDPGEETLSGSFYLRFIFGLLLYALWIVVVRRLNRWYQVRMQDEFLGISQEDSVSEGDH